MNLYDYFEPREISEPSRIEESKSSWAMESFNGIEGLAAIANDDGYDYDRMGERGILLRLIFRGSIRPLKHDRSLLWR